MLYEKLSSPPPADADDDAVGVGVARVTSEDVRGCELLQCVAPSKRGTVGFKKKAKLCADVRNSNNEQ